MVKIIEDFTGYPDGKKRRDFKAGEAADDLPAAFVALIVGKGHAVEEGSAAKREKRQV